MKRVSKKRVAINLKLVELRLHVLERDGYRCRWCRANKEPLEAHHVIKRSQAKSFLLDPTNVITLCRTCHAWTDAPYSGSEGRLVIERWMRGKEYDFAFSIVRAPSKFAMRASLGTSLSV
jgi:5-methylcytosine-specific restriction endonuclease McrA